MFHTEGKHVKGLEFEELNVFEEMKSWSSAGRGRTWQGPHTAGPCTQ